MVRPASICVLLLSLAACGGGGSSGKDLAVSLNYVDAGADLFLPVNIQPSELGGLDGHAPSCTVTSGSLAPGESIGPNCTIVGTPTAVGTYSATVTLTVDGFKGSVSAPVTAYVREPSLAVVADGVNLNVDRSFAIGVPATTAPLVKLTTVQQTSYVPPSSAVVTFQLASGTLPAGLAFEPSTGAISGTPTAYGAVALAVQARITSGASSFVTKPATVRVFAYEPDIKLSYGSLVRQPLGISLSIKPISSYVPVPGATVAFSIFGTGIAGLTVDPATGELKGAPSVAGDYPSVIYQDITYADGTKQRGAASLTLTVVPVYASYSGATSTSLPLNYAYSSSVPAILNPLPGDVYQFRLVPFRFGGTAFPSWLHVDPVTGRLFGTTPADESARGLYAVDVVLSVTREGRTYDASQVDFSFNL